MFYDDFFSELYKNKIRYLLGGGHAVNIYGIIRSTYDIDILFVINKNDLITLKSMAGRSKDIIDIEELKNK
jgi:hypothetical protein